MKHLVSIYISKFLYQNYTEYLFNILSEAELLTVIGVNKCSTISEIQLSFLVSEILF